MKPVKLPRDDLVKMTYVIVQRMTRERDRYGLPAQVLLAVYFFLAGCVVSQSRMLWVMPAASALFACALALTAVASSALSSSYR